MHRWLYGHIKKDKIRDIKIYVCDKILIILMINKMWEANLNDLDI